MRRHLKRRPFPANAPPAWAETVLRALVRPRDRDTIAGDLLEEFRESAIPALGPFRARVWYGCQVLSFLRAGGLARLLTALLPDRFWWPTVAGLAEYALLFLLPKKTGVPAVAIILLFAAVLLVAAAACEIRTAVDAWSVCRTAIFWVPLFGVTACFTVAAPVYRPGYLVASFLAMVPLAAFQSARRTGLLGIGIAAGFVIGTAMFLLWAMLAGALRLAHPPTGAYLFTPAIAAVLGALGAVFGQRFGRSIGYGEASGLQSSRSCFVIGPL